MNLLELQLSIKTVDILQKAGVWSIEDIPIMMDIRPSSTAIALASICCTDWTAIMREIKKRT